MAILKDSGERRTFDSSAVRDCAEGKGRCDLLPLKEVSCFLGMYAGKEKIIALIDKFITHRDPIDIYTAISLFITEAFDSYETAILEVAKHYEDGARKYDERNWEKGIPCHCYVDSAIRHYLKWRRGDDDEPHDRAFLWNMFGLLWTLANRPECDDLGE